MFEVTTTAIPTGHKVAPVARLGGTATTPEDRELEKNLHMVYVEAANARTEGQRVQYVVFPPAQGVLPSAEDYADHLKIFKVLERQQQFKGNRARWNVRRCSGRNMRNVLSSYVSSVYWDSDTQSEVPQWNVSGPIIVPLELDDYRKLTVDSETPQKALRAVDRELIKHGLTLK